jgi:hypothetical protein
MPSPIEAQIQNRIASFVSELDALVRRSTLEALQSVLAGSSAPVRRGPGRPAGSGRGPGRPRGRSSANLEEASAKIVAHVQSNDGQGIGAIAQATGLDPKVAKKAAAKLLASGGLKKSGQKRGTVYHVGSGRPARAAKAGKRGKRRGRKAKAA